MGRIQEIESLSFCRHKVLPLIHEVADRHLREEYTLEEKGKGNFVTSTDKSIEKELIRGLKALIPMSGVIAEESGAGRLRYGGHELCLRDAESEYLR